MCCGAGAGGLAVAEVTGTAAEATAPRQRRRLGRQKLFSIPLRHRQGPTARSDASRVPCRGWWKRHLSIIQPRSSDGACQGSGTGNRWRFVPPSRSRSPLMESTSLSFPGHADAIKHQLMKSGSGRVLHLRKTTFKKETSSQQL